MQNKPDISIRKQKRDRRIGWLAAQILAVPSIKRKHGCDMEPVEIDGPFLLIANHANNSDPILVGMASENRPLTFVASEHLGRLGFVSKLLQKHFSIISRSKASTAFGAVRAILKALKAGEGVLLFAEGDCTWNGVSNKVFPATGKLAKAGRAPLVTYRLEGNYLSKPRWAKHGRRGGIAGRIVHIYSPEELETMTADQITAAIDRDIHENAWETARRTGSVYRGKALAEGLEKALFICPECGGADCLKTEKNDIFCTKCGFRTSLSDSGAFASGRFPTVLEWDLWQEETLSKLIKEGGPQSLFGGEGKLRDLLDKKAKAKQVSYRLDLKEGALVIDGRPIPLAGITDMAMVKTERLLFTDREGYFELFTKDGILRPYLMAKQAYSRETEKEE
ncbi:MAG: 1-acyl-sn-glycerol-3-phosphate acyltransferase [Clostridia bacterium]|nr:1-acyl-sn-glycerol-3-phosphate acyltransferase [Clostridia bacterium]